MLRPKVRHSFYAAAWGSCTNRTIGSIDCCLREVVPAVAKTADDQVGNSAGRLGDDSAVDRGFAKRLGMTFYSEDTTAEAIAP